MAIATSKETRVRLGFDIASGEKLQFNCSRLDMPDRSKEFLSISQTRTYLRTARRVTESAARLVSARMKGRCPPAARRKAEGDFVTEVDVAAAARHPGPGRGEPASAPRGDRQLRRKVGAECDVRGRREAMGRTAPKVLEGSHTCVTL